MRDRYLVVGDPVEHSLSPAMMRAAFADAGLHAEYAARRVRAADLSRSMIDFHREGIRGINVTVPLKEEALRHAATVTGAARAIGAVNTLIRHEQGWEGDNTDGPGFVDWTDRLGISALRKREALVIGAGGSARAVVWALVSGGCPHVRLANRTRARAEALAEVMRRIGPDSNGGASSGRGRRVTCEAPGESAPAGGLVVNCTSLGLRPGDPPPIAAPKLAPAGWYLDLVYPEPPGVRAAREAGVPAENGLGLLVAQGARSFTRWTGRSPRVDVMRRAAENELLRRRT